MAMYKIFRQFSIRRMLFAFVPIAAVGFLVVSRWQAADRQQEALLAVRGHPDISIDQEFDLDELWWDVFWGGGTSLENVNHVSVSGDDLTKDTCECLAKLPRIHSLELSIQGIKDPQYLQLLFESHPKIRSLTVWIAGLDFFLGSNNFARSDLLENELRQILKLASEELSLTELRLGVVSDQTFSVYQDEGLEVLELSGDHLTNKTYAMIARMSRLRELDLVAPISDDDVALLGNCVNLETLAIASPKISGESLPILSQMSRMRELSLHSANIGADHLSHLAKLKKLTRLDLSSTKVDDRLGEVLVKLPKLEALDLSSTAITDEICRSIGTLLQLKELYADNTLITDQGLQHLRQLDDLETLGLRVTATSLAELNKLKTRVRQKHGSPPTGWWNATPVVDRNTGQITKYIAGQVACKAGELAITEDYNSGEGFLSDGKTLCSIQRGWGQYDILNGDTAIRWTDDRLAAFGMNDLQRDIWSKGVASFRMAAIVGDTVMTVGDQKIHGYSIQDGRHLWAAKARLKLRSADPFGNDPLDNPFSQEPFGNQVCGDQFALSNGSEIHLIDSSGQTTVFADQFEHPIVGVGVESKSKSVVFATKNRESNVVAIRRLPHRKLISEIPIPNSKTVALLSPDATTLVTFDRASDTLRIWDVLTGKERANLKLPGTGDILFDDENQVILPLIRTWDVLQDPFPMYRDAVVG